jgi:EAL domain-containing protein (putative c-di-GMP-specific phosphodiesterase class I)
MSRVGRIGRLDELADLVAMICGGLPCEINVVDEAQVFTKGAANSDRLINAREHSMCSVTAATGEELLVENVPENARFRRLGVGAYAGVPVVGRDGLPLGAVCVYSQSPRAFSDAEVQALRAAARQVVTYLELRRLDHWAGRVGAEDGAEEDSIRLRRGMDVGEIVAYYQPVVDLQTGHHVSIEALLRWRDPERGLVMPGQFLPAVETSGLVHPVGRAVLRQALRQVKALRADHLANADLSVAVNVSPRQVSYTTFADTVLTALEREGVGPSALTLEITENVELTGHEVAVAQLRELRDVGVGIALDDYGVGYSSLLRLLSLPITTLKLDRGLVRHLPTDCRMRAAAQSTVRMCNDLGLITVAEGIETTDQLRAAADLGCTLGQGYLFAAPTSPENISEQLAFRFPYPVPERATNMRARAQRHLRSLRAGWSVEGPADEDLDGRNVAARN